MAYARVVSAHRAPQRPPIRIAPGDAVTLGERDSDWPQFVWTTRADGLRGWVPATLFDAARGPATALQAYDTRELDADAGELPTLQHELAGWWRARNARGDGGWIPARVLAPATDAGAAP